MNPLVSVIVPVYNVRKYIEEALDSVINQTYQNLEILVIDDGSTDGSSDICEFYKQKDQRIKVFHQKNKGVSVARNVGLDHMTGELVAFLDSDDAYEPEMIDKLVHAMQSLDADIVKCATKNQRTEGTLKQNEQDKNTRTNKWKVLSRQEALIAFVYGEINIAIWNKLYRKDLWKDFHFQEGVLLEDVIPAYQILNRSSRIGITRDKLINHRIWPGNTTQNASLKYFIDHMNAYEQCESFILENIPDIYSEEHYRYFKTRVLRRTIEVWDVAIRKYPDAAREIRKEIIKRGREADVRSFSPKLKIKYWMICCCPRVLLLIKVLLSYSRKASARLRRLRYYISFSDEIIKR